MNKCNALIVALMVMFADANNVCVKELENEGFSDTESGVEAFKKAYFGLTRSYTSRRNREHLHKYVNELFDFATLDFEEKMFLSPLMWCGEKHKNDLHCIDELIKGGFKAVSNGAIRNMSSFEAFQYAYLITNKESNAKKNVITLEYFQYMFKEFEPVLEKKRLKNILEFCTKAKIIPNYPDYFINYVTHNQIIRVQDKLPNQNEEGYSSLLTVTLDNDGQEIDLNKQQCENEDNEANQIESFNVEEGSIYILDLNSEPK